MLLFVYNRYVGNTAFSRVTMIGLELEKWSANGNNGSVNGKQYFACPHGQGYFVPLKQYYNDDQDKVADDKSYHVGDRVRLTKNRNGIIKYIGKPHFSTEERFGIELDKWSAKGHDGRVGAYRYFQTKYGHGTFVPLTSILEKLSTTNNTKDDTKETEDTNDDENYEIGDTVELLTGKVGTLRFFGSVHFAAGLSKSL